MAAIMPTMNPDGEAFVERYEAALKQLSKIMKHDPLIALDLFDTMKAAMAHDFQACLRAAVYKEAEYIRERLEAEYRSDMERLLETSTLREHR